MKVIFSAVICSSLLISCSSSRNTTTAAAPVPSKQKSIICSDAKVYGPHLNWIEAAPADLQQIKNPSLPSRFSVFTLSAEDLNNFFNSGNYTTAIPLPEPVGCAVFELKESGTMSEELKKKYPNIVSLKGGSAQNKTADARIDFDGTKMRGQIIWGEYVFMIRPVEANNSIYYLVYNAKDTRDVKEHFESAPIIQTDR